MSERVTYGTIKNTLLCLGFDVTVGPNYRLYRHAAAEAEFVMPDYPAEQIADAMRLATVRTLVAARGSPGLSAWNGSWPRLLSGRTRP